MGASVVLHVANSDSRRPAAVESLEGSDTGSRIGDTFVVKPELQLSRLGPEAGENVRPPIRWDLTVYRHPGIAIVLHSEVDRPVSEENEGVWVDAASVVATKQDLCAG